MQHFLQPLRAVVLEVLDGTHAGRYPSLVTDWSEQKEISVGTPMDRGSEVRVDPGSVVFLQTHRPDGLRRFASQVLRREQGPPPSLVLAWPERVERIQRREHVRVDVAIPVEVRMLARTPRTLAAVSSNLSTGGMRLRLGEEIPNGTLLGLVIRLRASESVECEAQVAHVGKDDRAAQGMKHWMAVEFTRISEPVRKQITQFLFEVQREQIRKGVA